MLEKAGQVSATSVLDIDPTYLCGGALGNTTFGELRQRVDRFSKALRACGVGVGDAVAVMLPNNREWLCSALAISQIGAYQVPLNWHLTAAELAYLLSNSHSRALMADHRFASAACQAVQLVESLPQACLAVAGSIPGFLDLQQLLDEQSDGLPDHRLTGSVMF
jgi:long-chain acyl-CoA synthetase